MIFFSPGKFCPINYIVLRSTKLAGAQYQYRSLHRETASSSLRSLTRRSNFCCSSTDLLPKSSPIPIAPPSWLPMPPAMHVIPASSSSRLTPLVAPAVPAATPIPIPIPRLGTRAALVAPALVGFLFV